MKVICVILCVSLLISGCYSSALLKKDESAPDDRDVKFYLQDSSRVESGFRDHSRVEGGYRVDGQRFKDGEKQEFHGLIRDPDIVKIEGKEMNVVATISALSLASAVLVFLAGSIQVGGWLL